MPTVPIDPNLDEQGRPWRLHSDDDREMVVEAVMLDGEEVPNAYYFDRVRGVVRVYDLDGSQVVGSRLLLGAVTVRWADGDG